MPEREDPWQRLRRDLSRLMRQDPPALQMFPDPSSEHEEPPVAICLAPHAERVAADLHAAYGDFVDLRLGALRYPADPDGEPLPQPDALPAADPDEIGIALQAPSAVRSGHTVTRPLLLTNRSDRPLTLHTNGRLTARIVDPATGTTVGGFSGMQNLPLVLVTAEPGATVTVPLVIGTASYQPQLGNRVPAGEWQLTAELRLADGRRVQTPGLPVTITD